jgi:hypothetical protein
MPRHKKHRNQVPPGNQPQGGPPADTRVEQETQDAGEGAPFQDQDPKRRLGNYEGPGEHSFQQPGGKNDANR